MVRRPFQYRLRNLLLFVSCVALILGAAQGTLVRLLLVAASIGFLFFMGVGALCLALEGTAAALAWAHGMACLPFRFRQLLFERRLAQLRPGHSAERARSLLGTPRYVAGFGDRLYWSYRVAGRRYTVSFDPRRLVAKYPGGLARDRPLLG